ncbi:MAG TPA: hypothetical protein VGO11_13970 [Chthoniobacteraceae bacterium]|jgi:hypothetical protein|nr:hypothetical protein [Chthoniobacteraceae bacterium]
MALFSIVFLLVALVLIGVGVAIGLFACAVAAALVGLGVVSSSIFVGIRSGRPGHGVRAFLLQCGILGGIPAGAVCAYLAKSFFEAYGNDWRVFVYGGIGGAVAGVIVALLLDYSSRRLAGWASARATRLRDRLPRAARAGTIHRAAD